MIRTLIRALIRTRYCTLKFRTQMCTHFRTYIRTRNIRALIRALICTRYCTLNFVPIFVLIFVLTFVHEIFVQF